MTQIPQVSPTIQSSVQIINPLESKGATLHCLEAQRLRRQTDSCRRACHCTNLASKHTGQEVHPLLAPRQHCPWLC